MSLYDNNNVTFTSTSGASITLQPSATSRGHSSTSRTRTHHAPLNISLTTPTPAPTSTGSDKASQPTKPTKRDEADLIALIAEVDFSNYRAPRVNPLTDSPQNLYARSQAPTRNEVRRASGKPSRKRHNWRKQNHLTASANEASATPPPKHTTPTQTSLSATTRTTIAKQLNVPAGAEFALRYKGVTYTTSAANQGVPPRKRPSSAPASFIFTEKRKLYER